MDVKPGARASSPPQSKGWHSRGYLPHLDAPHLVQFVTFRLSDSVPADLIDRWQRELEWDPGQPSESDKSVALHRRIEQYADAGHGACHLRVSQVAMAVQDSLLHFDGQRYRLLAWCIMPNHVHVLVDLRDYPDSLSAIIHSWKSYTANASNKLLNRSGLFWMPDYFDRYVRDDAHLAACTEYIRQNPVKAGLVDTPEAWPWTGPTESIASTSSSGPRASSPHKECGQDGRAPDGVPAPDDPRAGVKEAPADYGVALEPACTDDVPPGYRRTEVGVIPEDWTVTPVGDVAIKVGSGKTPTGGSLRYKAHGRPFMRSQNVGWGELLLDDLVYIDDATHSEFPGTELHLGDVLLNITGASIGRSAVVDERLIGGNVNQHVCIIRTDPAKGDPRFVNALLVSNAGQDQIDSFQAGGNRQGLNFHQVRSISLPLPPTEAEQGAIAGALSDADALIESMQQLIAKQRAIKRGAMQALLTGRQRLPGFAGTRASSPPDCGQDGRAPTAPNSFSGEWQEVSLGDIAGMRRDRLDPRTVVPQGFCVELEHIAGGTGRLIGHTSTSAQSSLKSVFQADDVLFGKLRAYLRKCWHADRDGVCSTEIWCLFPKGVLASSDLLFQIVQTDSFVDAASVAYGTHMPRSDWKSVQSYVLRIPIDPKEQTAIAAVLSDMDAAIDALEARLAKTRELKAGMMQQLLTGRIRLPLDSAA